jgi:hypothetical protein
MTFSRRAFLEATAAGTVGVGAVRGTATSEDDVDDDGAGEVAPSGTEFVPAIREGVAFMHAEDAGAQVMFRHTARDPRAVGMLKLATENVEMSVDVDREGAKELRDILDKAIAARED